MNVYCFAVLVALLTLTYGMSPVSLRDLLRSKVVTTCMVNSFPSESTPESRMKSVTNFVMCAWNGNQTNVVNKVPGPTPATEGTTEEAIDEEEYSDLEQRKIVMNFLAEEYKKLISENSSPESLLESYHQDLSKYLPDF